MVALLAVVVVQLAVRVWVVALEEVGEVVLELELVVILDEGGAIEVEEVTVVEELATGVLEDEAEVEVEWDVVVTPADGVNVR